MIRCFRPQIATLFFSAGSACPISQHDRMVMHANRLLGVPRLRQLRVTNTSCSVPSKFKDAIKVCYNHYSSAIEDRTSFGPGWRKYSSADA